MATSVETYTVANGKYTIPKDPDAVLDYSFDWAPWLSRISDTIVDVVWVAQAPLVVVSQSNSDTAAAAFVSGGVDGTTLRLTCRISTAGGRTDDRSVFLKIVER